MDVNEMAIVGWELNHCKPLTRHIPAIISFLGYVPGDLFPSGTTGEKIRRYRMLNGISRKILAKKLHIDDGTLRRIESGQGKVFRKTMAKIIRFVESLN